MLFGMNPVILFTPLSCMPDNDGLTWTMSSRAYNVNPAALERMRNQVDTY